MKKSSDTTTLRDYLDLLSRRRSLILAIAGVAVMVGLSYSLLKTPVYEATATIKQRSVQEELGPFTPGVQLPIELSPEKQAAALTDTVTRGDVVQRVQRTPAGAGRTASGLRDSVTAVVQPTSNLVSITVMDEGARRAADLANQFARATTVAARDDRRQTFSRSLKELQAQVNAGGLDADSQSFDLATIARLKTLIQVTDPVQISTPASVPGSPASPKPVRDTVLAAILGLIFGVGAAFGREALDRTVSDPHSIQQQLGLPLLGHIREDALGMAALASGEAGSVSEEDLEAFRILRTNVDFLSADHDVKSVLVTSALPEEGKSTVAAWFAYVSAIAGRRTLLVECDLRRPVLAERFGVAPSPGLSNFLAGDAEPKDVLRPVEVDGRQAVDVLPIIPAGGDSYQPTEMLRSEKFLGFLDQVTRAYDLVVLDSAPLLPVSDTLEMMPHADCVLFCVRMGQTTVDQAQAARDAMSHLPPRPTGLVLTGVPSGSESDYYGYYSYTAAGGDEPKPG